MEREGGILTNRDYNHRCPGFACDTHELGGALEIFTSPTKTKGNTPCFGWKNQVRCPQLYNYYLFDWQVLIFHSMA